MKTPKYQRRFYRDWVKAKNLHVIHFVSKETDLAVFTDKPVEESFIKERVFLYRWQIENYISRDNRFLTSLKPVSVEISAAPIVKKMAEAAFKANVGPMSAVAAAIAEFLGRDLLRRGCCEVIVENGGDIFLKSKKMRVIGIYAGKSNLWNSVGIKIEPQDTPLGVCTSSGTLGHSLSFGLADNAIIISKNAILADAVATAVCNSVKNRNDFAKALEFARAIKGIKGVAIIMKNDLISWGKIELTPLA